MSSIKAIRNDGKEYSSAQGSLKTIFKMIYTLPESKSRQIIVDKEEFKKFIKNANMMDSVLKTSKFVDCMSQQILRGKVHRALAIGYEYGVEIFFVEFLDKQINHYIINKVFVDGRIVYIAPASINMQDGLMLLTI